MSEYVMWGYIKSCTLIVLIIIASIISIKYIKKREDRCKVDVLAKIRTTTKVNAIKISRFVAIYEFKYKDEVYVVQGKYRVSNKEKKLLNGKEYIIKIDPDDPGNILDKITWREYFRLNTDIAILFIVIIGMIAIPTLYELIISRLGW